MAAAAPRPLVVRAGNEVRGTQSFVQVMAAVWRRPSLTGLEVLWRWAFGAVALWLIGTNGFRIWMAATGGTGDPVRLGIARGPVTDLMGASVQVSGALGQLLPPVLHAALWLIPVLFVGWVLVSALGRAAVMRRMEPTLKPQTGTMMVLGAVRLLFLGGTFALWFWAVMRVGEFTVTGPAAAGAEPNLVLYFAMVIGLTLVLFLLWAAASWVLSIAPVLALLRGLGAAASLRAALRLGPLRGKLVEINLVMGIVKAALVVLAMVFSASPLPFQTYATQGFLWGWWAGVTVLYLLASDYFHVVRSAAYLALWRSYQGDESARLQ